MLSMRSKYQIQKKSKISKQQAPLRRNMRMQKALIPIIAIIILSNLVSAQATNASLNYVWNGTNWIPWLATSDGKPKVDLNLFNVTAGSLIVDTNVLYVNATNDKVGIGTTSPISTLHVTSGNSGQSAPISTIDDLIIENSAAAGISIFTPDVNAGRIAFGSSSDADFAVIYGEYNSGSPNLAFYVNGGERARIDSSGNVGIGTTTPGAELEIHDGSDSGDFAEILMAQAGKNALLNTTQSLILSYDKPGGAESFEIREDGTTRLAIDSAGEVGVGTTAPDADLDVKKSEIGTSVQIRAYNTDNTNSATKSLISSVVGGTSAGDPMAEFIVVSGSTWTMGIDNSDGDKFKITDDAGGDLGTGTSMTIDTSNKVGIGTTNPTRNFEVQGSGNVYAQIETTSANAAGIWYKTQQAGASNVEWFAGHSLTSGGRFDVRDNNNSVGVYIPATSSGGWTAYSDLRLKENVETLSILDKIENYRAVSFNWKKSGKHDIGVIAQELNEIFPEIVDVNDDGVSELVPEPNSTAWGVQYSRIGALALAGVKELNDEIKLLKEKNAALEKALCEIHPEAEICS